MSFLRLCVQQCCNQDFLNNKFVLIESHINHSQTLPHESEVLVGFYKLHACDVQKHVQT